MPPTRLTFPTFFGEPLHELLLCVSPSSRHTLIVREPCDKRVKLASRRKATMDKESPDEQESPTESPLPIRRDAGAPDASKHSSDPSAEQEEAYLASKRERENLYRRLADG
jgi:hypothetical protein